MTLVRETFRRPQGKPTEVRWSLIGDRGPITVDIPVASPGADVTYVGAVVVAIPDGVGDVAVTVDLVPSSTIVPAGTRWQRTGHRLDPLTVLVPVVGAGVVVDAWDIVTDPPASIAAPALEGAIAAEAAARTAADTAEAAARVAGDDARPTLTVADGRYLPIADPTTTNARTPTLHAGTHATGGTDAVALTGEQITSGTVADARVAGTIVRTGDARMADERAPLPLSVTDAKVAAANKDGTAATPSLRTLGTGAQQAAAGNDARLVAAVPAFTGAPEGLYHRPPVSASSSYAFPSGDFRMWLVNLPAGSIRSVGLVVTTAGDAASRLRPVIYRPDGPSGAPGTLVVDGGQLDTSTAGVKSLAVPVTVWAGGWVWVGAHLDAGTAPAIDYATAVGDQQVMPLSAIGTVNTARNCWQTVFFPQGPAPAVFPVGGGFNQTPPIVAIECY